MNAPHVNDLRLTWFSGGVLYPTLSAGDSFCVLQVQIQGATYSVLSRPRAQLFVLKQDGLNRVKNQLNI